MKSQILILLCFCLLQVISYPLLGDSDINLETDYDLIPRNVAKKDIFMSRGWGASGMPYSAYWLDKPTSVVSRHKNRQQPTKPNAMYASKEQDSELKSEANNFEALRSPAYGDDASRNNKLRKLVSPPKNKYTVPQLFISYGWGPMG
ncbi:uncharacterized protein LOC134831539 isoform X2 [Culicoides brevitarsis]